MFIHYLLMVCLHRGKAIFDLIRLLICSPEIPEKMAAPSKSTQNLQATDEEVRSRGISQCDTTQSHLAHQYHMIYYVQKDSLGEILLPAECIGHVLKLFGRIWFNLSLLIQNEIKFKNLVKLMAKSTYICNKSFH